MGYTITNTVPGNPVEATRDFFNLNSYCHIDFLAGAGVRTLATALEFNPWGPQGSSVDIRVLKTPDIDFDSTDGSLTVNTKGSYFICFNPLIDLVSSNSTVVCKIIVNDSDVFETDSVRLYSGQDPEQITCNTILTLEEGDVITMTADGAGSIKFAGGTSCTMFKLHASFSNVHYTAAADEQTTTSNIAAYDSDIGGTVATNLNGITFTASNGVMTPSTTGMYLYFSTWIYDTAYTAANDSLAHKLCVTGSSSPFDEINAGATAAITPLSHTYSLLRQVDSDQNASIKRSSTSASGFTFEKGTSWSFMDISRDGFLPTSFFAGTLKNDSNLLDDSTHDIYDDSNYGTFVFQDINALEESSLGSNRGIVLDASDAGRIRFSESGDYLIISNFLCNNVQNTTTGASAFHGISVNDSATYAIANEFYVKNAYDPITNVLMGIISLEAGDTIRPQIALQELDIDDGTSITIIRLGPSYPISSRRLTSARPRDTTENFFDEQGLGDPIVDIKNTVASSDKGDQRYRRAEQSPFRMNVNGPLTLRGRARSSLPFNVAAGKRGDEK